MTDSNVEAKVEKLTLRYLRIEGIAERLRPVTLPTGRERRRIQAQLVDVVNDVQRRRRPEVGALVRLAYVRGMRSVRPQATMDDNDLAIVSEIEEHAQTRLARVESSLLGDMRSYLRRLGVAQSLSDHHYPDSVVKAIGKPRDIFPLEQRAREVLDVIVGQAWRAGEASSTATNGYDGGANGDR